MAYTYDLKFADTTLTGIIFNGTELTRLIFNGTDVIHKVSELKVDIGITGYMTASQNVWNVSAKACLSNITASINSSYSIDDDNYVKVTITNAKVDRYMMGSHAISTGSATIYLNNSEKTDTVTVDGLKTSSGTVGSTNNYGLYSYSYVITLYNKSTDEELDSVSGNVSVSTTMSTSSKTYTNTSDAIEYQEY